MVNGLLMERLIKNSLIITIITTSILSIVSSSSSTETTASSNIPISGELLISESKDSEDKNDLLKDLKDIGPDDLARLIKAKKEKDLDEFRSKVLNVESETKKEKTSGTKGLQIVQQQEEDYPNQDQSNEDGFSSTKNPSGNLKKPDFTNLNSLFPFLPNPGSVTTMMVKPIDSPEQMVCDCFSPSKMQSQQQQQQQQQLLSWPNIQVPSNTKLPVMMTVPQQGPQNPFAFIGQHFAHKTRPARRKKQFNPLSFLFMGLGNKRKRSRQRPAYPAYPPFSQQPTQSQLSGFEPNDQISMYPPTPGYSAKGKKGGRKGHRRSRRPPFRNLPPPPSISVKGRSREKSFSSISDKWHWDMDDYKDSEQGFNQ